MWPGFSAFPPTLKRLLRWTLLASVLNGVWEVAQLPLYTLWGDPDHGRVLRYLLHCTAGDALIAAVLYLLVAGIFRDSAWPARRPWSGSMILVTAALAYAVFSEWYNVYRAGAWSYAAAMPLVYGIGITPLLQWLAVPALMILGVRRLDLPPTVDIRRSAGSSPR